MRQKIDQMRTLLRQRIEGLPPGYFALVMATGILAAAADEWGFHPLALTLFAIAALAHLILLLMNGIRVITVPRRVLADCADPRTCFGFFTVVAGGNVLASWLAVHHYPAIASWLWVGDTALGLVLANVFFTALVVRNTQPLPSSVNGTWLIAAVATHSVVIVAVDLAPWMRAFIPNVIFVAWLVWTCGLALYALILAFVWQRLLFSDVSPHDLTPPYWISMGAAAIGALAGTRLVATLGSSATESLQLLVPFTYGLTLLMWGWATWWIPQLIIFGVWRHVAHRQAIRYDSSLWGMVFPLGMYATVTAQIWSMTRWGVAATLSLVFLWIAGAAWLATFVGMVRSWLSALSRRRLYSNNS